MDQNSNQTPAQSQEASNPPEAQPNSQAPVLDQPTTGSQPAFSQPVAPVVPGAQPNPVTGQSQPGGKPKKSLIIGLIAAGILLVGGIIAAVLLLSGPSKDDYKKAYSTSNDLVSAYNAMNMTYLSTSATETEIRNDLDTLKTNRGKFNDKFNELKSLKAVSRDKDINEVYKAVVDKKAKLDASLDAQVEAFEKILPVVRKISEQSSLVSDANDYLAMVTNIRGDLQALELKSTINKEYVSALVRDLQKLEELVPKVKAGRDDYTRYDSGVTTAFYDTVSSLSNDDRDWRSNMDKLQSDGEIRSELNKLQDTLMEKANK